MTDIFKQNTIIIKEKQFKISNCYDIFTSKNIKIGEIKETFNNFFEKLIKIIEFIKIAPSNITFYDLHKKRLLSIRKPFSLLISKITINDQHNKPIGLIKYISAPIPKLKIYDKHNNLFAIAKGNFLRWNFEIMNKHNKKISVIDKKFKGVTDELVSGADDYAIHFIHRGLDHNKKKLILATAASIDLMFKDV